MMQETLLDDRGGHGSIEREVGPGYIPPKRKQQWFHAAFILIAEIVGTGVMALPETFSLIGAVPGTVVLLSFAFASWFAGILLWRLQVWFPEGITYGDMAFAVLGRKGQKLVFFFIYVAFFGNLAIYVLTCAESLQAAFSWHRDWCKWWFTVATVVFLVPFCQLRTLHHVSFAAAASSMSIFVALIIILYETFHDEPDIGIDSMDEKQAGFFTFVSALTTAIFAFGGQGLFFETMAEMKQPNDFPKSLAVSTIGILSVYLLVALSCNAVYGQRIKGNILFSLPDGPLKSTASFLLFFHVCISFVLAQQVVGRAIHVRWRPQNVDTGTNEERQDWFAISSFQILAAFLIANGIPFFSHLMGLVAAISTAPLTFGAPAVMVYIASRNLRKKGLHSFEKPMLPFFVFMTIVLVVLGFVSNVHELISKWSNQGHPFACHPHP